MSVRPAAEQARTFSLRRVVPYVADNTTNTTNTTNTIALPVFNGGDQLQSQIRNQEQLLKTAARAPSATAAGAAGAVGGAGAAGAVPSLLNLTTTKATNHASSASATTSSPAAVESSNAAPNTAPTGPRPPKLSFSFGDALSAKTAALAPSSRAAPPKLHQPVQSGLKIDLNSLRPNTVTGARLAPDAQKEALRLTVLAESLNEKIASQQTSLDTANAAMSALKRQLSTEKAVATKEIARIQSELCESKAAESNMRLKISKALHANESIRANTVAPLQERVEALQEQVASLKVKLEEKPATVEVDGSLERVGELETHLDDVTRHRNLLQQDIYTLRKERDAAMEHVISIVSNTGCMDYGDGKWKEGEESEEEEEKKEKKETKEATTVTSVTSASFSGPCCDDENDAATMCANAAKPTKPAKAYVAHEAHALEAVLHSGTEAPGCLPRLRPPFLPSLAQLRQAADAATDAADAADAATDAAADNQEHVTTLIRAVMNDLYVAAEHTQTTKMRQSGNDKKSIEEYFQSIRKARAGAGV